MTFSEKILLRALNSRLIGSGPLFIDAWHTKTLARCRPKPRKTSGVSRQAINNWLVAHERGGDAALAAKTRGRPKKRTIAQNQQAKIVRAIQGKCPDQLKLSFAL